MKYSPVVILILGLIFFSCSKSENMRVLEQADAIIEDDSETSKTTMDILHLQLKQTSMKMESQ